MPTAAAEIAPKKPKFEIDVEEDDVEVSDFGEITRPNLKPYLHNARFIDKQYGFEGRTTVVI